MVTKSCRFGEDGIGRRRPGEGPGVGVVLRDEGFDMADQIFHLAERSPAGRKGGNARPRPIFAFLSSDRHEDKPGCRIKLFTGLYTSVLS